MDMRMKKYLFLVLASLVTLALVFFLTSKPTTVNVLTKGNLIFPFNLAQEQGLFKKFGRNTIVVSAKRRPVAVSKNMDLASQDFRRWFNDSNLDIGIFTTDEFFKQLIAYPDSIKAFGFFSDTRERYATSIITLKELPISKPSDFEGRKLAFDSEVALLLLDRYMQEVGVKNYTPIRVNFSNWQSYLTEGKVDVVWATEPIVSELLARDIVKVVVANPNNIARTELSGSITEVVAFKSGFLKEHNNIAAELSTILSKVATINQERIRQIGISRVGNNEMAIKEIKARTHPLIQTSSSIDKTLFQKIADRLYEQGSMSQKIDVTNHLY